MLIKSFGLLFLLLLHVSIIAQYRVVFNVVIDKGLNEKTLYIASNQNNWNPADALWQLKRTDSINYQFEKILNSSILDLKITKGGWSTVETDSQGNDISNRHFTILSDTTINIVIHGFKDAFLNNQTAPIHTASPQVKIISDSFFIPQLNTKRRIWIYLPKTYDGKKKFPVLYMQDGQNLFDAYTSAYGEWKLDEFLDSSKKEIIVVGIDHGGKNRLLEYSPFINKEYQINKPLGKKYAAFVATTLKKFIDKNYLTLSSPANTFIAGSSMGGLIAYYTALQYPNIFGKVGVFSPSFWINRNALKLEIAQHAKQKKVNYYFYAGTKESDHLVNELIEIYNYTSSNCKKCNLKMSIKANKQHNELSWQEELPDFFKWLFP